MNPPDQRLISRAWRRIAVQTAAAFALALFVVDALAIGVILHIGRADSQRQVNQVAADPDALTNPPPDMAIYQLRGVRLRVSPGAAADPADPAQLAAVAADGRTRQHEVYRGDREYLVHTYRQGTATVQVVLDLTGQERERHRLYLGLAAAGGAGLVLAALIGAVVARRAIAPLGQALVRQQRFIADASHELRTPLTQLHTRAQLLDRELRGAADPDRLAEDADQLVRGTRQLGEVVAELLLAAQLRTEPQRYGPVDLHDLVRQTAGAEAPRAAERRIEVRVQAETPGVYVVRGAQTTLRRVLVSLLDNAFSHTDAGGHIILRLRADPVEEVVEVIVSDDGEGFDPADTQRMFQRFARGRHGDRRRFGLGLSLVREAVEAHGGTVAATGAPGQGATFTLRLPAWTGEAPVPEPDEPDGPPEP